VPRPIVHLSITVAPDVAPEELEGIQLAITDAVRRATREDRSLGPIRCVYVPAHCCMLVACPARDEEKVYAAVRTTRLPFTPLDADAAARLTGPTG
jgi:hypothetical protein